MTCSVGLDHQELKANDELWSVLDHVDDAYIPPSGSYPALRHEQRNCICGSTIARKAPSNDDPGPEWHARRGAAAREIAAMLERARRGELDVYCTAFGDIESAVRAACASAAADRELVERLNTRRSLRVEREPDAAYVDDDVRREALAYERNYGGDW
jgi:hypothetical protein